MTPFAAVVLALLTVTLGGCASAPAPAPAEPPAVGEGFAFRDPRAGAPPPPLASREEKALAAAVEAIRRGEAAGARKALETRRRKGAAEPAPMSLAAAYLALAEGRLDDARGELASLTAANPTWIAAVEAAADLAAAEGRTLDALEGYRVVLRLSPSDRRARERADSLRKEVASAKKREAEEALAAGSLDAARRAAHSLLQLEPASASGYVLLSRAAAAGGGNEDAWTWAREARRKAPNDRAVAAFAADVAAKAGRWADAASLYEGLAAADPAFGPKAEEARLEFRIQNLPETAHRAADSPRLTRAELASLLWWTVPEVREALVPPGVGIAVDVVDRPDRVALVKVIGLGFLTVSAETHRVGTDAAVSRTEFASSLRRVAVLAGRGRAPAGCLAPDPPSDRNLSECGILPGSPSRNMTGREALRALDKAARLGREGGTR